MVIILMTCAEVSGTEWRSRLVYIPIRRLGHEGRHQLAIRLLPGVFVSLRFFGEWKRDDILPCRAASRTQRLAGMASR